MDKVAALGGGAAMRVLPVARLFALGPRQTWFNLVQYHAHFRSIYWPETAQHDLEVLTSWIQSGPATMVGGLAIFGLWHGSPRGGGRANRRTNSTSADWMAAGLGALAGVAHPTFPRYFALAVPFVGALAAVGLDALRPQVAGRVRLAVVAVVLLAGLGRSLYERREVDPWSVY